MNFVTWKYNPFKLENSYVNNCSEKKDFFITVNTIEIVTFTGKQHLLNTRCKSTKKNKKTNDYIIKIKEKPLLLLFSDSQTYVLIVFPLLSHHFIYTFLTAVKDNISNAHLSTFSQPKRVREQIKKSSRTFPKLFANSFVHVLNLANSLRIITLQQLV